MTRTNTTQSGAAGRRSWVQQVMGMPISLLARGDAAADQAQAALRVFAFLQDVDVRFSPYRADSELSRFVRGELRPDELSRELLEVRDLCELAWQWTGGLFDARTPSGVWDPSGLDAEASPVGVGRVGLVELLGRHLRRRGLY